MKNITQIRFIRSALLTGALVCSAGLMTARADTIVTFSVDMGTNIANGTFVPGTDTISVHGTFDGWTAGVTMYQEGSSTIYTNTVDDTVDANGGPLLYKFVNSNPAFGSSGGYENLCDGGGNRGWVLPATSGSTLVLPTPFYADSGAATTYTNTLTFQVDMTQQIALGTFTNGVNTVSVSGNFNNWSSTASPLTNDPSILITNEPSGLITSNVYTGTFTSVAVSPNAHMAYQFVMNGTSYEGVSGANNDGGGNRFFTMLPADQTFPIVFYHDAPYGPTSQVTFSVDMSIVVLTDTNFDPSSVTIWGDFNGWGGGVAMTNDPSASNTNIYTSSILTESVGTPINYQFRYLHLSDGSTIYDHLDGANGGNGNRYFQVPNVSSTNVPPVFFNDASLDDYFLQPTPVFFSVDMTWATTNDLYAGTNNIGPFQPSSDNVYINGQFANWYAWSGGATPTPAPPGYQMIEQGLSMIYTNTVMIPAGTPVAFNYKYGTDPIGFDSGFPLGGPVDDEAAFGQNHYRVVRSSALNPYQMPVDEFHNMYGEPFFDSANTAGGELTVGPASGGTVPVEWLGRPGARLQWTTDLASGNWQEAVETDGTNWTAGYYTTNGLVSQTNWPTAGGNVFFRLVKP